MKVTRAFPNLELTEDEFLTLTHTIRLITAIDNWLDAEDKLCVDYYLHSNSFDNLANDLKTIIKWAQGGLI